MIVQPERYIDAFAKAGADVLTVHYEACTHLHRTVQEIKAHGMKAGVSVNPHTSVKLLEDILPEIDLVLIMSVNPGFGGQSFIKNSLKKITELRNIADVVNSGRAVRCITVPRSLRCCHSVWPILLRSAGSRSYSGP